MQWYSLDLRVCDSFPYDEFRNASERINSQKGENTFSVHYTCSVSLYMFGVHYTCSVSFRKRIKRKQQEESSLNPLQREEPNEVEKNIIVTKRSHARLLRTKDKVCFVCEKSADNSVSYNDGGIGRCSEDTSEKLLRGKK